VKAGELQVWDVVNTTLMDHPFHLHGFFFQVLSVITAISSSITRRG
jgi:FtsP/CotA-like multicopper oxidase with cupredoxin domain